MQYFFNMNSPYIASWVVNPDEKVTLSQALTDWQIVISRPDEFTKNTIDNIVPVIMERFKIISEQELQQKLLGWEAFGEL
jgi:hypothetical protein